VEVPARIFDPEQVVALTRRLGIRHVQVDMWLQPDEGRLQALAAAGVSLVYAGIQATYDTDPSWVLARYLEGGLPQPAFYEVQLLTDIDGAWESLRDRCPEYPEELQVADLDEIAARHALSLGLDFTPSNVVEILARIPHALGVSLTLGTERAWDTGVHLVDPALAEKVVQAASERTRR
jgi:hypothetical protein